MLFLRIILGIALVLGMVGAVAGGRDDKHPCLVLFTIAAALFLISLAA